MTPQPLLVTGEEYATSCRVGAPGRRYLDHAAVPGPPWVNLSRGCEYRSAMRPPEIAAFLLTPQWPPSVHAAERHAERLCQPTLPRSAVSFASAG